MTDLDPICLAVDRARTGENRFLVREFETSVLVVHDIQFYAGHCVLLLKNHVRELHQIPAVEYSLLMNELVRSGAAIAEAFKPWKLNYQCLGNEVPHIHWHIIPRYNGDPNLRNYPFTEQMRGEIDLENYRISSSEAESVARRILSHLS